MEKQTTQNSEEGPQTRERAVNPAYDNCLPEQKGSCWGAGRGRAEHWATGGTGGQKSELRSRCPFQKFNQYSA